MPLKFDTKTLRSERKVIVICLDNARVEEWRLALTYEELRDGFGDLAGLDLPPEHDWREDGF